MVDAACLVFALWTLACHGASFLGGSFAAVLIGFAGLLVALLVWRLSPAWPPGSRIFCHFILRKLNFGKP